MEKTLQATNNAVTKAVVVLAGTVMEYQENDFAKDILNNADHNLLGQDRHLLLNCKLMLLTAIM